jgi:hypothetical protein
MLLPRRNSFRSSRFASIAAIAVCLLGLAASLHSRAQQKALVIAPTLQGLTVIGGKAEAITYRGKSAIHVSDVVTDGEALAMLSVPDFKDGTIELELTGMPSAGASDSARGFVGVAFRMAADHKHYECFYLRPTNGRADDQLRRNHSTQYVSEPDYPWFRLRKENPGVYESYVDLEPGAWTKVKIVVSGQKAALYVHAAEQPCLIVNDLKGAEGHGKIALWLGNEAEGYFSEVKVTPAP